MTNHKNVLGWDDLPAILTTQQVAEFLQVSPSTVKKMCQEDELKAKKLGAGWRVNKADLYEFMHTDGSSGQGFTDRSQVSVENLSSDLRQASELIEARISGQKELASRLKEYAVQFAQMAKEESND